MTMISIDPSRVEGTAIVAERFGSFQGEGPWTGQRCVFVRFSRCNLTCCWCDTRYTWDWTRLAALAATGRVAFKFVVTDPDTDFDEIAGLVQDLGLDPVWVMPEGDTREKVLAGMDAIHAPAVARGWNLSTRLHVLTGAR